MNQHAGDLARRPEDRSPRPGPAPIAGREEAQPAPMRDDEARAPTRDEVAEALSVLARHAEADPEGAAARGRRALARRYPEGFAADEAYRAGLPDLQNGPASSIRGARRAIGHAGVSNVRLPARFATPEGEMTLEARLTATVALGAEAKGVNMSRLTRLFEARAPGPLGWEALSGVLDAYIGEVGGPDARLALRTAFPLRQRSLRSGLEGWQYYDAAFELAEARGARLRVLHLDYVYASTCPCSLALSEHAREARGQLATPHSQRSLARVSVALAEGADLGVPDLVALMRRALPTETQAIVKREDEQAFAELNAAHPVFVEDAARLVAEALAAEPRAGDFRVAVSHQESLHSHDAVAVLTEGPTFACATLDPWAMGTLAHGA